MLNFLRPLLILMAVVTAGMPAAQARMSYDQQGSGRIQVPSGKSGKLLRFPGNGAVSLPAGLAFGTYAYPTSGSVSGFANWLTQAGGSLPAGFFGEAHGPGATATGSDALDGSSGGWDYNLGVPGWSGTGKTLNLQSPLLPKDKSHTLQMAAGGSLDAVYTGAAQRILAWYAANNPTQTKIVVRPGQEMNANYNGGNDVQGDWSWQIVRNNAVDPAIAGYFAEAFRRYVNAFRAAAVAAGKPGIFEFDFCANLGSYDWSLADPGPSYVDYYSIDGYYGADGFTTSDGGSAWDHMLKMPYGFQAMLKYARDRSKKMRIPEIGVSADLPELVAAAYNWITKNSDTIVSVAWWNGTYPYNSFIADGSLPGIGAVLRNEFNPAGYSSNPLYASATGTATKLTFGANGSATSDTKPVIGANSFSVEADFIPTASDLSGEHTLINAWGDNYYGQTEWLFELKDGAPFIAWTDGSNFSILQGPSASLSGGVRARLSADVNVAAGSVQFYTYPSGVKTALGSPVTGGGALSVRSSDAARVKVGSDSNGGSRLSGSLISAKVIVNGTTALNPTVAANSNIADTTGASWLVAGGAAFQN